MRSCIILIILVFHTLIIAFSLVWAEREGKRDIHQAALSGENAPMSLTLEDAINLALEANRNIISSRYTVQNRRLSFDSAESEFELKIFPSARAGIGGNDRSDNNDIGAGLVFQKKYELGSLASIRPQINKADSEYDTSIGVSFIQPLLRGLGRDVNLNNIRSAEFSVRTSNRNLYQTRVNSVLDTVSVFYEIIKQKKLIRLYESLNKRLKGHAEVAQAKEKVGLATPMDTFRANINLKDSENSLTNATEAYRNAKDQLKTILALSLDTDMEPVDPARIDVVKIGVEESLPVALANRVELEQANDDIREGERKTVILKNNTLPELNLIMDYEQFGFSDTFSESAGLGEYRWGVSLQSSTDFYRTAEKTAYKQGRLNVQSLRLHLEDIRDEIKRQVRSQVTALREAEKRIQIRKDQIKQAEGKLALAEIKFAHGMANNFNVIEAETEIQKARVNLISSETEYINNTYNMLAVLGTLIERENR